MSGIYLIVWDNDKKDNSPVLKATKGGWPHITIAYTGKILTKDVLLILANDILKEWALQPVTLSRARVNSFTDSKGNVRHDVLLDLETTTNEAIEKTRRIHFGEFDTERFSMQPPHVTYGICSTELEAIITAKELNEHLPYRVVVIGTTID